MSDRIIIRLPTTSLTMLRNSAIIDNLCSMGIYEIAKDAIFNALHVFRWCEGKFESPEQAVHQHFDYAEFWEWLKDRYDDPYQLALCRKRSVHEVVLSDLQLLMVDLLIEWRDILPVLPYPGEAYADVVEIRSDYLEATIWFSCTTPE